MTINIRDAVSNKIIIDDYCGSVRDYCIPRIGECMILPSNVNGMKVKVVGVVYDYGGNYSDIVNFKTINILVKEIPTNKNKDGIVELN